VRIDVALTAEALAPGSVAGTTVLVVDVLRASTSVVAALGAGCLGIIPVENADEARRRQASAGADVLLAGERRGETIAGFDLGNSPVEFASGRARGRVVIFTTSNGTRALLAARGASAIGVAGLVNLSAAAAWALAGERDVTILCAGERGARSLEDQVCAGLLVERLRAGEPNASVTELAGDTERVGRAFGKDVARLREESSWARHLTRSGRGADVTACLALDITTLVPVYLPDVDKVVSGPR
jgi:2-phosphosulfolactate phosphatase